MVSFKYFVARLWFVSTMFFLGTRLFRDERNWHRFGWAYLAGMSIVIIYTLIHHAQFHFEHDPAHWVMSPFFKDHTSYGALIAFFIAWNDFVYGISLTSTSAARPVPAALAFFTGASYFEEPTGAISAAAVVVTIPVVVLVVLFQRQIVSGLTQGAVKG